ncbi:DUF2218 domain-containing protein [Falsiroseomonas stagni]|uniref:2,4-dihydroxyhept-2-ene-1,7-dioic acid aldolase n=1 Tax=Falsiroseomonas stagni DSM 19981 TaxID=1123062 RepID=A0A1I4EJH9_9PROT|nr:DUF2218 domain-containing protein [Falsiroseomonas stagni]SFL05210.1 hypothetical protein SAMN02745775_11672 [Falsiroseomonas stagni DSM 19981]
MITTARVETATPSRYLGQLCKHFAHRIPASHDERQGRIEFPEALCELEAEEGALVLRLTTAEEAVMARMQKVVADHLLRFAFRDPPQVVWQPG